MDLEETLIPFVVQRYKKMQRIPFRKAAQKAQQADANSIQRIILLESESALRAYCAVKKATESDHGFTGQAKIAHLLDHLSTQSIAYKRAFAKKLALELKGDGGTVVGRRKNSKRRRTALESGSIPTPSTPNATPNIGEQPCLFASSTTKTRDGFMTNHKTIRGSASDHAPTLTIIPPDISHPATERLRHIFPPYMCSAISRLDNRANLTIAFPTNGSGNIDCLMSLVITPNEVQHIAKGLFDANLEIDGNIRYIIQEGGRKTLPGPELHLQGAQDEDINRLLGDTVNRAVQASPVRIVEISEAVLATSCVALTITRLPQEGAVLNLNLEIGEGFGLKRALFD